MDGELLPKPSYVEENRNNAFRAFISCGGNLTETQAALKRLGLPLTTDTLSEWAQRFNWRERMKQADMVSLMSGRPFDRQLIVDGLARHIATYDALFMTSPELVDVEITQAYCALLRVGMKILNAPASSRKFDPEQARKSIQAILEAEYGAAR